MSCNSSYRVAVVGGAGVWGRRYMVAYARRPQCRIVGLVDRAVERRNAFAEHYGAEAVYDDVEDLLADQVPDIVSVILPVAHTPGAVMACARAGVRVVSCEKPIAISLEEADEVIDVCRACGTELGCSCGHWDSPHLVPTAAWLAEGHLGRLTDAAIPVGLPDEVAGGGCIQLAILRLMTGRDVEWVEGWALPPRPDWKAPAGATEAEIDSTAYGRLGLSGDVVCEIPPPDTGPNPRTSCNCALTYENGRVWVSFRQSPYIVKGTGPTAAPINPRFLWKEKAAVLIDPAVERLLETFDHGGPIVSSGHDYRQALEIAIAMKQSAVDGHRRIDLPMKDRTGRIYPQPHRLHGGDVVGWENTHYKSPPEIMEIHPDPQ